MECSSMSSYSSFSCLVKMYKRAFRRLLFMDLFTLISSSFAFSITFCLPSYPSNQFVHCMHKELFLCQFLWSNLLSLIIKKINNNGPNTDLFGILNKTGSMTDPATFFSSGPVPVENWPDRPNLAISRKFLNNSTMDFCIQWMAETV